ncbi:Bifunctional epoxide hydrolase 2 [Fusarium oxysporum f. sp. albedinis]|nr:Bifunctional epoxide hydrolase 2 [Fusarium oxysporum f. sp. albedinis]
MFSVKALSWQLASEAMALNFIMYNKAKIAMVLRANTGYSAVPQTSSLVVIRALRRILFRSRAMLTLGRWVGQV